MLTYTHSCHAAQRLLWFTGELRVAPRCLFDEAHDDATDDRQGGAVARPSKAHMQAAAAAAAAAAAMATHEVNVDAFGQSRDSQDQQQQPLVLFAPEFDKVMARALTQALASHQAIDKGGSCLAVRTTHTPLHTHRCTHTCGL